jgi:hypothetical protein
MRICTDLGFVFHPSASDTDNALVLRIWLEALIASDRVFLARNPDTVPLYKSGVVYGRTKVWDSTPDLYARRYGDCKSLSATLIAQLRQRGQQAKPVFRFMVNSQTGQKDFHILVQRPKSVYCPTGWEDPSRKMGMEEYHRARNLWVFPE